MKPSEARNIFGLGPDEDPRPHLAEFRLARERIAEWVRTAPNEILADRYQAGLVEFDQALAAILESLADAGTGTATASRGGAAAAVADLRPASGAPAVAAVAGPRRRGDRLVGVVGCHSNRRGGGRPVVL